MGYDNFGLKIGIEGEREFRNSIKEINSSFKTLKSEMNLLTSTFTDNKNSMESLTAKSNLLGREVEEQRKKVTLLEAALKNASSSFGENDKRTENWAIRLNYAKAELSNMEKELGNVNDEIKKSETPLEKLNSELDNQEKKLKELQTQYKSVVLEQGENSKEAKQLATQIKTLTNDINENKEKLNSAENALSKVKSEAEKSQTPLDRLNDKFNEQSQELEKLQKQYKNVVLEQGKNSSEAKQLATKIKTLNGNITENKEKLNAAEKATDNLGDAMKDSGEKASKLSEGFTVMKGVISNLLADAIKKLGQEFVSLAKSMVTNGIEFESAFAGVKKTVDATDEEISQFESDLRKMSTQMPITATELSGITEAAGQLGIKNENLMSFTETMANLGAATNMSSEEAATSLSRLANITGMNQKNFNRLGSSIVALGNNFATTESEVTQMALNISAAGTQVGMTEADILGVSAALSSLGLEAQAGGTAISKAIIMMANAVESGSSELEYFAKAAGMSTSDFKRYFKDDATGALTTFIAGLGNLQDESALKFLDDMGISETRLRDALLRASNANELFTDAIKTSNNAWEENSALTEEARKRYETTESKVQILKNTFTDMGLAIFEKLQTPIQNTASKLSEFFQKANESGPLKDAIDKLSESAGKLIEGISEIIINVLPPLMEIISWMIEHSELVGIAIGGIATAMIAVKSVKFAEDIANAVENVKNFGSKLFELASHLDLMQVKEVAVAAAQKAVAAAQWLVNAAMDANPIGLIILAIAALVAAFVWLWNNCEDFRNFWIGLWEGVQQVFTVVWDSIVHFFKVTIPNAWNSLVSFFTETIPKFIQNIFQWFNELPSKIGHALNQAISQVIQWGVDLWNFAITKIPQFIRQIVTFFSEIPSKIWSWLCSAVQKVSEWGGSLISAGKEAAINLINCIWNTLCELPQKMLDIGKNLVMGLWNGINNVKDWILDKIKGFGQGILNGIKSCFGIASPSKLFEDEVGKNLALGLGEGFTDSMKKISKDMQNSIPTDFDTNLNLNMQRAKDTLSPITIPTSTTSTGFVINIENFVNNRSQDVQSFAKELEFYTRRSSFALG